MCDFHRFIPPENSFNNPLKKERGIYHQSEYTYHTVLLSFRTAVDFTSGVNISKLPMPCTVPETGKNGEFLDCI